jgi:tetratricopeptide (TPR) repeat protein
LTSLGGLQRSEETMQILTPGTRIGQYEIASRPMMGGMGVVYFALDHSNNGRPVAIKTFRPELLPDRTARDRFLREGTAWIELGSHPHIVRCYTVEYIDPTAFLVLELIAKEQNMPDASLRSWLVPGQPLPLEQALLFALQIARGMQYATEKIPGFVHRDLKPENILVGTDKLPGTNINRLRVTDFGLVKTIASGGRPVLLKATEELEPNQIQFTRGIGTPLYMASEQWKGEPVGVFTDVYAFGCMLYEMLCGQPAIEGKTISELQKSHCDGRIRSLSENLPKALGKLIAKCLALNSTERFLNWKDVLNELEQAYTVYSGMDVPQVRPYTEVGHEQLVQESFSYIALGVSYQDIGKVDVAAEYLEKALKTARVNRDRQGEIAALGNLGNTYGLLGDTKQAISCFEQSLKLAREIGERQWEGIVLNNLGGAYKNLGDARLAISFYKDALEIHREVGNLYGEGSSLNVLGMAYADIGDLQKAIQYYEQALVIIRNIGNKREEGNILNNLGKAYRNLGEVKKAIIYYEKALLIARSVSDRHGEGAALGNLGVSYFHIGNINGAIELYKQQLIITQEIGDQTGEGSALNNIGDAYRTLGKAKQAIEYYEKALVIFHKVSDRRGEGSVIGNLGNAYADLGKSKQAIDYYEQQLVFTREVGDLRGEGNALGNLGAVYLEIGSIQQAVTYCEKAIIIQREIGDRLGEGNSLGNLGSAYLNNGETQQAINYYEQAISVKREIGDFNGVATISFNTAILYARLNDVTLALPRAREAALIWKQIGSPDAKSAQQLYSELQKMNIPVQTNPAQAAFDAFQLANSLQDMQAAVKQYPAMANRGFIQALEEFITEEVRPEDKPRFKQHLEWLHQIASQE